MIKNKVFLILVIIIIIISSSCGISNQPRGIQEVDTVSKDWILIDSSLFFQKHHNRIDVSKSDYLSVTNLYVRPEDRDEFEVVPDNVMLCENLKYANFSFCENIDLKRTLPKLSKLKKLERLNLIACNLDSIPSEIGLMKQVKKVQISINCLEKLPEEITEMENLEELSISLNFKLDIPHTFKLLSDCKSLKSLTINGLGLSHLDKNIGLLKELETLILEGNDFMELPCELMELKKLTAFSVAYSDLNNLVLPKCFKNQEKLGGRNISFYNIEGEERIIREKGTYKPTYTYPKCMK